MQLFSQKLHLLVEFKNYKKSAKVKWVSYAAILVAVVGIFLASEVGTTGGEIRHTEIRTNATSIPTDVVQDGKQDME